MNPAASDPATASAVHGAPPAQTLAVGGSAGPGAGVPVNPAAPRPASAMPQFRFELSRLSQNERLVGGATLVLFISFFLPWFSVSAGLYSVSGSGLDAHGYLYLPLILSIVLVLYLVARAGFGDELPFKLPISDNVLLMVVSVINVIFVLIGFFAKPGYPGINVGWSYGAFIGLIAALVAVSPYALPFLRTQLANRRKS